MFQQNDVLKDPKPNVSTYDIADRSIKNKITFWIDIFQEPENHPESLGESTKARVVREINEILLANKIELSVPLINYKIYDSDHPLST